MAQWHELDTDWLASLNCGDTTFIEELALLFDTQRAELEPLLTHDAIENHRMELREILHKTRGSAGTIGLKNIRAAIERLSAALKTPDVSRGEYEELLSNVMESLQAGVCELKDYIKQLKK